MQGSGPISLQTAFHLSQSIPQKSSSETIIIQQQYLNQLQKQSQQSYEKQKELNKRNTFFNPIVYNTNPQMKSKSSIYVQVRSSLPDNSIHQSPLEPKKMVQIVSQNPNIQQQPSSLSSELMARSQISQGKSTDYFSHREFIKKDNLSKQDQTSGTKNQISEKEYRTSRPLLQNDDKRKSLSQHQQNQQLQKCSQKSNCNCTSCQIKSLYSKLMKMNQLNKKDQQVQNVNVQQTKSVAQNQQNQQEQQTFLHYSTLVNNDLQKDNLLQSQTMNQFNSLDQHTTYNHSFQKDKFLYQQQQLPPQLNYINASELLDNQFERQSIPDIPRSKISLSESISLSGRQQNEDQSLILQQQKMLNQQKQQQQQQQQAQQSNREEMLSRMYEQNTQLQQLVQDQQTYIQLLYNQMIQYQSLLDINKIPYTAMNNNPQFSDSNFSILGSTAAASPVISQFCHSARTSDLGYSEVTDSPLQEPNLQSNLANQYQKYCQLQQLELSNTNNLTNQYLQNLQPLSTQSLQQSNQIGCQLSANFLQNSSQISQTYNNSHSNLEKQYQNDGKQNARSSFNEGISQYSPQQNNFVEEKQSQFLMEKGLRAGQSRSKSIYNSNSQMNSLLDKEPLQDSTYLIKTLSANHKSTSLTTRQHENIKNIYSYLQKATQSSSLFDKHLALHDTVKSNHSINSNSHTRNNSRQQNNIQQMMYDFKLRLTKFLQNVNNKNTKPNARNHISSDLSLPIKKQMKNGVKLSNFMSPQNSPPQQFSNSDLERHIKEVSSTKDQSNTYESFNKPQKIQQLNLKYFPSLNKLKEQQNSSRQNSKEKNIQC